MQEPTDAYDEYHKGFTNYDERYKAKLNAAENMSANSSYAFVNNFIFLKKQKFLGLFFFSFWILLYKKKDSKIIMMVIIVLFKKRKCIF